MKLNIYMTLLIFLFAEQNKGEKKHFSSYLQKKKLCVYIFHRLGNVEALIFMNSLNAQKKLFFALNLLFFAKIKNVYIENY